MAVLPVLQSSPLLLHARVSIKKVKAKKKATIPYSIKEETPIKLVFWSIWSTKSIFSPVGNKNYLLPVLFSCAMSYFSDWQACRLTSRKAALSSLAGCWYLKHHWEPWLSYSPHTLVTMLLISGVIFSDCAPSHGTGNSIVSFIMTVLLQSRTLKYISFGCCGFFFPLSLYNHQSHRTGCKFWE